jgi:small subunit ribosomal protein S17
MAEETVKANKQEKIGEVVSTKMQKTIVVQVTRRVAHPLYKRILTRRNKFYAHDEEGKAKVGDQVRIIESRPLSKLKRWSLDAIVRSAVKIAIDEPSEKKLADKKAAEKKAAEKKSAKRGK